MSARRNKPVEAPAPTYKEALTEIGVLARARLSRDMPAVIHDNPAWAVFQLAVQDREVNPVQALLYAEHHSLDTYAGPLKRDYAVYMRGPRMQQPNLRGLTEDVMIGQLRDWIGRPMRESEYDDLLTLIRAVVRYYQQKRA